MNPPVELLPFLRTHRQIPSNPAVPTNMRSLVLAASLAASASAFLVVSEVSKIEIQPIPANVLEHLVRTVNLDCPKCPVRMPHGRGYTTKMASHLQMKFEVDLGVASRLLVNGFEIYPSVVPFMPLKAPHIVDMPSRDGMMRGGMMHGSSSRMKSVDPLGFSALSRTLPPGDDGMERISLDLHVIEVSSVFVDGIPRIHVELVKDKAGMLAIEKIGTVAAEPAATTMSGHKGKPKCSSWMCSWVESLGLHWDHWRPHCGMGAKNGPKHPGHGGPHDDKPHHDSKQSPALIEPVRSHGTWVQLARTVVTHVLLPILIGVMAGVAMSFLGMVVGAIIVAAYRMIRGSPFPSRRVFFSAAVPAVLAESKEAQEQDGLMENQEPPPSYEEAPVPEENADAKV